MNLSGPRGPWPTDIANYSAFFAIETCITMLVFVVVVVAVVDAVVVNVAVVVVKVW